MIRLRSIVTGKVQGVRFRDYVQVSATALGLVGYVRNLSDGTVDVVAEGEPDTLKELVEHLNEGSLLSKVESVSVDWGTATATYREFSVLQ
jgi:acylphosphatase